VRNDLVEADLSTFVEAIRTGVIEPWAAINFGDSRCAPTRVWLMPDADEDARRTSIGEHLDAFFAAIDNLKSKGFDLTPAVVSGLCKTFGVGPFTLKDVAGGVKGGEISTSPTSPATSPPQSSPAPAPSAPSSLDAAAE
jgi:hypothetical protein